VSEYQRAVLGQILIDPDVWHRCGLIPSHFTDHFYREVFTTMSHVLEAGEPLDMVTLRKANSNLSASRIAELTDSVPTTANAEFYVGKVKDEARRHWLWRLAKEATDQLEGSQTTDEVLGFVEEGLVKIALASRSQVQHIKEGLKEFVDILEERFKRRGEIPGITTGFEVLDDMFGGFEDEKLYYIGARPSQGKSALLLNFLRAAAMDGKKCGLISLESSRHEAYSRIFADIGGVENSHIRKGLIGKSFGKITDAAGIVNDWSTWVCDDPELTVSELKTVARKMVIAHHVEVLYIDYLQYIRADREQERRDHVAETSRALKALARQLEVPVVCAVQLRRDADNRVPHLGDFAESSQVEKDADVALLIHSENEGPFENTWLKVAKNRDGATGDVQVYFDKEHARFSAGQTR
jgi:replicative DNA helicase